jgi:hypothetical protein
MSDITDTEVEDRPDAANAAGREVTSVLLPRLIAYALRGLWISSADN